MKTIVAFILLTAITASAQMEMRRSMMPAPAPPAGASATLVSRIFKAGNVTECETNLNTVGATLLVRVKGFYSTEPTSVESEVNTWTRATNFVQSGVSYVIDVATNPTTSATHSFSLPTQGGEGPEYHSIGVFAFGSITTAIEPGDSARIAHAAAGGGGSTSQQTGASVSGRVFVTVAAYNVAGTASIDQGFAAVLQGGSAPIVAVSHFISTSGSVSKQPTWTKTGANANISVGIVALP